MTHARPKPYIDLPHGITTVDAAYVRPGVACLHLLTEGNHALFIDTGTSLSLPNALHTLADKGLGPEDVEYVIPTHVHLDHAGGAGAMMATFTNARLIVHPRGARHMIDPQRVWAGTVAVYGAAAAKRLYGEVIPVAEDRVIVAGDEFELDFHGRLLRFLDTPGHARHHFCVLDTRHAGIFCGDTMGVSYRPLDGPNGPFLFPATTPVQFEPEALHHSVDRLMATDPQSLYIAHFGCITPTPRLIDALHRQIDGFVRIAQSLGARTQNPTAAEFEERILAYMIEQAKSHGVPLAHADLEKNLAMDARLNAQGVATWWQRQTGSGVRAVS